MIETRRKFRVSAEIDITLQGTPEAARVILVKSQLSIAEGEGQKVKSDLDTAVDDLELLHAGLVIGEFGTERLAEADSLTEEIGRLEEARRKNEITCAGLRR